MFLYKCSPARFRHLNNATPQVRLAPTTAITMRSAGAKRSQCIDMTIGAPGDRKIKQPLPPTASAHPLPPCPLLPAPGVSPHAPRQRLASAECRRLAPQRTDRTGGWGRAACTAGAARGEATGGGGVLS